MGEVVEEYPDLSRVVALEYLVHASSAGFECCVEFVAAVAGHDHDDAATVGGVAFPPNEPPLFEAVDHPSGSAGRQPGALCELAGGERPGQRQQVEAGEVGAVESDCRGSGMPVEELCAHVSTVGAGATE